VYLSNVLGAILGM